MKKKRQVYLAGKYERKAELRQYAEQLETMGHLVTSNWLFAEPQFRDDALDAQIRWASDDLKNIQQADTFVLFTNRDDEDNASAGKDFESGVAFSQMCDMVLIGKRRNIFHCLHDFEVYDTWLDWLNSL